MTREIFTTGELARILRCSAMTITRCADRGVLKCMKAQSGHRRFNRDDLVEYMRAERFPLRWLHEYEVSLSNEE